VAVAKAALRTRENLVLLRAAGRALAMHLLRWPDDLRPSEEVSIPETRPARPQELQMAKSLMQAVTEDFRLEDQRDEFRIALDRVVTAKLEGVEPPHAPEVVAAGGVEDLMSALERSLEAARRGRANDQAG
jgi:DNA end-binding protein Ku